MSYQATTWVIQFSQSRLSSRLVLHAIAHRISNESGQAWPSINTLAREANVSRSMVKAAIRDLVRMGELELTPGGKGPKDTHTFRIPLFLVWMANLQASKGSRFAPLSAVKELKSDLSKESESKPKGTESGEKRSKVGPEPTEPLLRATINKIQSAGQHIGVPVDWIPPSLWTAFSETRLRMRKPLSEVVVGLLVRRLQGLRDHGNDVTEVIEQSIRNGWADFYEVKREKHRGNGKSNSIDEANERIRRNLRLSGLAR